MSFRPALQAPWWGQSPQIATDTRADRLRELRLSLGYSAAITAAPRRTHLVVLGDSITFGASATTRARTWVEVLRSRLNTALGFTTLGAGHVHAGSAAFGGVSFATSAGAPVDVNVGLGTQGVRMPLGSSVTITTTCRRVIFNFRKANVAGESTLEFRAGGALIGTANCFDATQPAGDGSNQFLLDSGDLGAHALRTIDVLNIAGAGGATFLGAYFLGDAHNREICVWNGGYPGASHLTFTNPQVTDVWTQLGVLDPGGVHLIHALGVNHGGLTPDQLRDGTIGLVNQVAAQELVRAFFAFPTFSRVLMAPFRTTLDGSAAAWSPYHRGLYAAAERTNAAVFDWWHLLGDYGSTADGVHPDDRGHWLLGTHLAQYLTQTW